ncbi:hypothetical protein CcaCcLH18_09327 [Colletotrichum camelliae]|nr:hypothetical protein CcaCcLH18_09327 [Colletotrichum camelliae]
MEQLEAEAQPYGEDDTASIDERLSNYSASLTSSVVDYPVEYGRRYHAFRPGTYAFPNDDYEMDRLNLAHAMIVKTIGNKLYLAPLQKERIHKMLDIGTGTGIWAVEMGDLFQNAEVTGNDLSPIQPEWVPPNVKFEVDDVESDWVGNRKYDYIMCRYMAASIADWPRLVQNIYDHLNPGGFAEFQEMDTEFYSDDCTYTTAHATWTWNQAFASACRNMGRDPSPAAKIEGYVKEVGFNSVYARQYKCPIGPWPRDPYYKDLGMMNLAITLEGLEAFTLKLFCDILGRSRIEVEVELAAVRNELKQGDMHLLFDM